MCGSSEVTAVPNDSWIGSRVRVVPVVGSVVIAVLLSATCARMVGNVSFRGQVWSLTGATGNGSRFVLLD